MKSEIGYLGALRVQLGLELFDELVVGGGFVFVLFLQCFDALLQRSYALVALVYELFLLSDQSVLFLVFGVEAFVFFVQFLFKEKKYFS